MNKRTFIKSTLLAGAGTFLIGNSKIGATGIDSLAEHFDDPSFPQYKLPYGYDALEPHIDAQTMEIHYSKHHAAYTKNFNAAVVDNNLKGKSIEDIFGMISKLPAAVRNNGGGYFNHNLFFEIMAPKAGGEPAGDIAKQIATDFGSFAQFKEAFSKAASGQFGSGWAWLIVNNGKLQIVNSPNQDNPIMDIAPVKGKPVLAIDVWEHAYYLKYQNRRAEYISAFWNVIDWKKVEMKFKM